MTVFVNAIMYYKVMDHHIMPMSSLSRICHHNHENVIIIMTMSSLSCKCYHYQDNVIIPKQSFTRSWRIIVRASYKCEFPSCTTATPPQYKCQHIKRSSDQYNDAQKVADATSAVANVDDYSGSARLLAATTLRCFFWFICVFLQIFCYLEIIFTFKECAGDEEVGRHPL